MTLLCLHAQHEQIYIFVGFSRLPIGWSPFEAAVGHQEPSAMTHSSWNYKVRDKIANANENEQWKENCEAIGPLATFAFANWTGAIKVVPTERSHFYCLDVFKKK